MTSAMAVQKTDLRPRITSLYQRDRRIHSQSGFIDLFHLNNPRSQIRFRIFRAQKKRTLHLSNRPVSTRITSSVCLVLNIFFSLQNKIAQNRYWPVEIMRTPIQQATKAKGKQGAVEEDVVISYHGVAYVNMAPLLYPGVNRCVHNFHCNYDL